MRTSLKWTLGILALAGIAGAGLVSAHGGGIGGYFGGPGPRGLGGNATAAERVQCDANITVGECRALHGEVCSDDITVGECRELREAQREEAKAAFIAECTERSGNATRCEELAERPPRGPPGPGHRGPHRGPPPGDRPEGAPDEDGVEQEDDVSDDPEA